MSIKKMKALAIANILFGNAVTVETVATVIREMTGFKHEAIADIMQESLIKIYNEEKYASKKAS